MLLRRGLPRWMSSSSREAIDFAKLGFDFTPTRSMVKVRRAPERRQPPFALGV